MNPTTDIAFLVDCDNTLLDNDRVQADLRDHLEREFGVESRDRYWAIFEEPIGNSKTKDRCPFQA